MARLVGKAGDFQDQRSANRRLNAILGLWVVTLVLSFGAGFVLAKFNVWWMLGAIAVLVPTFLVTVRLFDREIRRAQGDRDGADGEKEVCRLLLTLPDNYTIVSDLDFIDSFGNIDHLVVGPSGIFAVDVKNWRGTVAADGKGELLINSKPTDKPQVKAFVGRTMELKDRVKALTKLDPYIQCVFVFPRAYVEARWGTTGPVHCVTGDNVCEYITGYRSREALSSQDREKLVVAVEALKRMAVADDGKVQYPRGGEV